MKTPTLLRLGTLVALLLLTAALATGCTRDDTHGAETTAPETTAPMRTLTLFADGKTDFAVVRPEDDRDIALYSDFMMALRAITGADFSLDVDEFYRTHEYDPAKAEILCGAVAHPEAEEADDGLSLADYRITVDGEKIVIAAKTKDALRAAFNGFCAYVKENLADGALAIPEDFALTGRATSRQLDLLANLPTPEGYADVAISDCGDGYAQATLTESSAEAYAAYRRALEEAGFALYAENELGENPVATYQKADVTVHTYFTPHNAEMRLIAAKGRLLPAIAEVTYTKVSTPTVTLLGLEKGGHDGGLGCILGLEDGSFIVIDGGTSSAAEAADIANTLRGLAPDPEHVVIRAWIFTHSHGDHVGAFNTFSKNYGKSGRFTVEQFIYNFCDAPAQRIHGGCNYSGVLKSMTTYWPEADHYKALTGETYRFAGCAIEILYCMSDFIPQIIGEEKGINDIDLDNTDDNIETVVFRATLGGQTVLITGDTAKVCVDEMCDRYGDYLKSDLMTVPHHGWNQNRYRARNGTVAFYNHVDPAIVLWPAGVKAQQNHLAWNGKPGANHEANYHLVNNLHVKEVIVAGSTTRTLTLPYGN